MPPLFSVILPTYNRARMLRSALKSVTAQTFDDFECFVLDDGSTDETPRVFDEFRGEPRLRLFRFDDNRRQHARRNFALGEARGEFVSFLDSDDLWLPGRLETFAREIGRRDADFWFSNAYMLRFGRIVGTLFDPARPIVEGRVPGWHAVGLRFLPYVTTNLAVRRTAFEQVGKFREDMKILEDTELYARMLASGCRVGAIREPLAVRREHDEQITLDYEVVFREVLMALEAGGAPAEELAARRESGALDVADALWRGAQPGKARDFLVTQLGDKAKSSYIYRRTFIPPALLRGARTARRFWLMARHHPVLTPLGAREAYRAITPLLDAENQNP